MYQSRKKSVNRVRANSLRDEKRHEIKVKNRLVRMTRRDGLHSRDPVIPVVPIRNMLLRLVKAGIKSSRTVVRVGPSNKGPSDAVNASYEHVRCAYDTVTIEGRRKERETEVVNAR